MSKQSIKPGGTNYFHLNGKVDPISEIVNAGILTTGDVYWVKDASDADYLEFKDRVGREYCYTDIQSALNKCTADQNDYVMVCPKADGSAWELTTGLTMSVDKVHLIGVGSGQSGDTDYGVLVQGFGTSGTVNGTITTISHYGLLHVTGNGVEVAGIKFSATAGTGAGGTIGGAGSVASDAGGPVSVYGQNFNMHDCYLSFTGVRDKGTPSAVMVVGSAVHGGKIDNSRILTGTSTTDGTTHGVDMRFNNERWAFKDVLVESYLTNAEEAAFKVSPGTALSQGAAGYWENCTFINYNSGTVGDMVEGTCMANSFGVMKDCAAVHCTAFHDADALILTTPTFAGGTINNLLQQPGIAHPGTALIVTKT